MKSKSCDKILLAVVLFLSVFGIIMIFSASSPSAFATFGDSFYYVRKQLIWSVLGIVCLFICQRVDYHIYKKLSVILMVISACLLLAVLVVGREYNGAKRWIYLGFTNFQPSELTKVVTPIGLAAYFSAMEGKKQTFKNIYIPLGLIVGIPCALIILEPHFSCIVILALVTFTMMLIYKVKLTFYVPAFILGGLGAVALIIKEPYRLQRITAFMDPFADKLGDGWQIVQSLYAIGSGGFSGLGLSRSRQKYLYIPEPQNDFIFSIICEELGFIGAVLVLFLFAVLMWRSLKIAVSAKDSFGSYLAFGLCMLIIVQVVLNIGVVTASVPPTGIPLPFFSAGGTAFLFQMIAMGIILNISRTAGKE